MTQEELLNLFNFITTVDCSDDQRRTMLEVAAKTLTVDKLDNLINSGNDENKADEIEEVGVWKFTQKEISKMPKNFKKEFRTAGCTAHITKRRSGKDNWNYMIRYRKNGYNLLASSNNLEEAKRKFIEKLKETDAIKRTEDLGYMVVPLPYVNQQTVTAPAQPQVIGAYIVPQQALTTTAIPPQVVANPVQQTQPQEQSEMLNGIPTTLDKFANYYFENFYQRKVCEETYRITQSNYKNHVLPHFGDMPINSITPNKCQELLDNLIDEDKLRTEENVFTILNMLFKAAMKHGIIQHNPMDMVFHVKHAREHGKALSKEEEKKLLSETAETPYQLMFAIALYTGLRPNEYKTAIIENGFIVANNSKRKNGKVELKKIPITPMLKPYLEDVEKLHFVRLEQMRNRMKQILPEHKLYDMRTTFYTRCLECGISEIALKKFVGHSLGGLADTYTDLSDEFLIKEGQKLSY